MFILRREVARLLARRAELHQRIWTAVDALEGAGAVSV